MIPCYSLFLEVEIPDPSLNYFIINQHQLDNTEKLLAPPPIGTPSSANFTPRATETFRWAYSLPEKGTQPIDTTNRIAWDSVPPDTYFQSYSAGWFLLQYPGHDNPIKQITDVNGWTNTHFSYVCASPQNEAWKFKVVLQDPSGLQMIDTVGPYFTVPANEWQEVELFIVEEIEHPENFNIKVTIENDLGVVISEETIPMSKSGYTGEPQEPEDCLSGLNTFVLNASCLNNPIDLLEGWGAARPDYIWVDVITDTTNVDIVRGFDMKQGIVGSPIAGVMDAEVLDPYLDGLSTQLVAVGQRVRLRAGNEICFSGVCNSVRSEYDAINTPVLRIEAVDALGLLNAQMVEARPAEGYNTRIAEAASKVELPLFQQDSLTQLTPTEDAKSALELLVETQDSEGSIVWLDRYGALYSTNRYWLDNIDIGGNTRAGAEPRFVFTNNPITDEEQNLRFGNTLDQVCLSAYRQVADTTQVINACTFYNYTEEDDVDFEGLPIKTIVRDTKTYESSTSRRLYGDAGVKLTTYLPGDAELNEYAEFIFNNYDTPKTKVETLQFPLDKWDTIAVPDTVSLDIGEPLEVRIDDPNSGSNLTDAVQRIAQIRHRISPQEWLCELDLL
jgi:hypothetical protein